MFSLILSHLSLPSEPGRKPEQVKTPALLYKPSLNPLNILSFHTFVFILRNWSKKGKKICKIKILMTKILLSSCVLVNSVITFDAYNQPETWCHLETYWGLLPFCHFHLSLPSATWWWSTPCSVFSSVGSLLSSRSLVPTPSTVPLLQGLTTTLLH